MIPAPYSWSGTRSSLRTTHLRTRIDELLQIRSLLHIAHDYDHDTEMLGAQAHSCHFYCQKQPTGSKKSGRSGTVLSHNSHGHNSTYIQPAHRPIIQIPGPVNTCHHHRLSTSARPRESVTRTHGASVHHPRGGHGPRDHRHDPVVRPARTADMDQLAHKVHRGPSRVHDVPVGGLRRPLRRLQHHPELQRPHPGPAPVLHGPLPCQLGPGPRLRPPLARLDRGVAGCCRRWCMCRHRGCFDIDLAGECCLNVMLFCEKEKKDLKMAELQGCISFFLHDALPFVFGPIENKSSR